MAIEITRDAEYVYRQNPYNGRLIDRRRNKPYARWQHYGEPYDTEQEARMMLWQLQRYEKDDSE